ncbi:TF26 protein, partial [Pluvianellus socialis]|nr:TF26 protein [Pluvianellus socialis]
ATVDIKDMFFMVPLQGTDRDCFAFTWEGIPFAFIRLPQGYCHSPTIAHYALAQELAQTTPNEGVKVHQYIDDILVGGSDVTALGQTQSDVINHLESLGLQIPTEKVQLPSSEVKFLGIWWRGGTVCIPSKTLTSLEQVKMPENKKLLQHALGLMVFWRKHIPYFSLIACSLYDLKCKKATWDWTPIHEEALKLLIFEAGVYQALRPIHPTDP